MSQQLILTVLGVVALGIPALTALLVKFIGSGTTTLEHKYPAANPNIFAGLDMASQLVTHLIQGASTSLQASLAAGDLKAVVPALVAQMKQLLATEGSADAQKVLALGEDFLNSFVASKLAKLTPAKAA